jgi:hypothetical protein
MLPRIKDLSHVRGVVDTERVPTKRQRLVSRKSYQGSVNTIKIKAVCTSKPKSTNSLGKTGCNNGWMSDLETAVKPILTPLVLDQQTILGKDRQRVLATWIAMKAMVAEHSDPQRIVSTSEERAFLMKNRSPPDTWKIWIARQTGKSWYMRYMRNSVTVASFGDDGKPVVPLTGPLAKNTQLVTIGMGYVVFHIFSSTHADMLARVDYRNKVLLFRIHPFDSGFFWPPPGIVNGAQIDFLIRNFDNFLDGIPWASTDGRT